MPPVDSAPQATPHSTLTAASPLPPAKVSLLLNNFVLSTTRFLNSFVTAADGKIREVGDRITDVEVMMAILEAKLASVPELEDVGEVTRQEQEQQEQQPPQQNQEGQQQQQVRAREINGRSRIP